jgi:hypothetical protein
MQQLDAEAAEDARNAALTETDDARKPLSRESEGEIARRWRI